MKIRPLHDRLIIRRLDEVRKTASGIVIPDTAAEKPEQGEVTALGKGKIQDNGKVLAIDLKVGDRVLFGKYSGQTVRVEGEELLVMREEESMGVIEWVRRTTQEQVRWLRKTLSFTIRPAPSSSRASIFSPMQ